MSTSFPTSIDSLSNPTATSSTVTVDHAAQHTNANDAIEALEAKVGADSSAVTTSHDYKIGALETNVDQDVTSGSSPTFTNTNFTEATDKNYVTDAQAVVISNTSGTNTGDEVAASKTVAGVSELATTAEIDTGTDSTRSMPVDQFVASKRNVRYIDILILGSDVDQAIDTTINGDFEIPFSGTIISIGAYVDTAGTTGSATYDVNLNGTTLMSATKITIETGEKSSRDATTQPVLSTTAITTGDLITVDIDAIQTTPAKGLKIRLGIRE